MMRSVDQRDDSLTVIDHKCDLCGGEGYRRRPLVERMYGHREGVRVIQCCSCGLARIHPMPDVAQYADIYRDYGIKKDRCAVESFRLRYVYPEKLKTIARYVSGKRLLDIGAGMGTFVDYARRAGFEAIGVEFDEGQCAQAKTTYGVDLVCGKIEDVYQGLGTFDIINLHHVLEHVISPKIMVSIVSGLLKPGGICRIEVPNELLNVNDRLRYFMTHKSISNSFGDHLHLFSLKTLDRYLSDGFKVLEVNQFLGRERMFKWRSAPLWLYRTILHHLGIGVGGFIEFYARKR